MEKRIGEVAHYYNKISVAVLDLFDDLSIGETVHILGHTTDFTQPVESMEVDHQKVESVGQGDEVALKVMQRARTGDEVYKVV